MSTLKSLEINSSEELAKLHKSDQNVVSRQLFVNYPITDDELKSLSFIKGVQDLVITSAKITDSGMESLNQFPRLRSLQLARAQISGAGFDYLTLKSLRYLDLSNSSFKVGALEKFKTLEVLFLRGSKLSDSGMKRICQLKHLRFLEAADTDVTDSSMASLAVLTNLTGLNLKSTKISRNCCSHLLKLSNLNFLDLPWEVDTDNWLDSVGQLPLKTLHLSATDVSEIGLAKLSNMTDLECIHLSATKINSVSSLAALPKLSEVHLEQSSVTDLGISNLSKSKSLKSLYVRGTKITGLVFNEFVRNHSRLELLDAGPEISDSGLTNIAQLPYLNSLKLIGTGDITVLTQSRSLKSLDLSNFSLNENALKQILLLKHMKMLHLPPGVMSREEETLFKKANPKCQIIFSK